MNKSVTALVVGIFLGAFGLSLWRNGDTPPVPDSGLPAHSDAPPPPVTQKVSRFETDPDVITAPPNMDPAAPESTPRYSLEDAASRGLIEYHIQGVDASSGDSLALSIRRLTDLALDVYIVPGTVFMPSDTNAQRMVAWGVVRGAIVNDDLTPGDFTEVESVYLPDSRLRFYVVEAYCLDFDLDNPAPAVAFQPLLVQSTAVGASAEPDVRSAQLIRAGKQQGLSSSGIQVAIWADRDHRTKQDIQPKFTVEDKEMEEAFQLILDVPPPASKTT